MGMMGMGTALMINLWFGIHLKPYTIALFFAFIGGAVALKQISFHACPNYPAFGYPVMGFSLYTWSFIVFCCAAISIFAFLFFYDQKQEKPEKMHHVEWLAFIGIIAVTLTNCGLLYTQCGFEQCKNPPPQHAIHDSW
jgi:RsiW-degrading membrane proteinase PrsW (M82 family)